MSQVLRTCVVVGSLACAVALLACAKGPAGVPAPVSDKALFQLAVIVGTDNFLTQHPAAAQPIWQFAHDSRLALQGEVDATQWVPLLKDRIGALHLDAPTTVLLLALADSLAAEITLYVQHAHLQVGTVQLLVAEAFGWMEQAALAHLHP